MELKAEFILVQAANFLFIFFNPCNLFLTHIFLDLFYSTFACSWVAEAF